MSTLLRIDGWSHSGKAILKGLLDGHPDVFTIPFHDIIHQLVGASPDKSDSLEQKSFLNLRTLLAKNTRYFHLEEISRLGTTTAFMGMGLEVEMKCPFDFYRFDRMAMNSLASLPKWTSQSIVTTIYQEMYRELCYSSGKQEQWRSTKYTASMSGHWRGYLQRYLDEFEESKIIYILRPVEAIIATHYSKLIVGKSDSQVEAIFSGLLYGPIISDILEYQQQVTLLRETYPRRVMRIHFSDFFTAKESLLKDIITFLDIPSNPTLSLCTLGGQEIRFGSHGMLDGEINTLERLLSTRQRAKLIKRVEYIKSIQHKKRIFSLPVSIHRLRNNCRSTMASAYRRLIST